MENLFDIHDRAMNPLADRMRPQTLDDIVGQDHIVGSGRLLRRAISRDRLSSIIFYGPPGTGKTSLARVIANTTRAHFESLNAVLAGIKDIRDAIDHARDRFGQYGKKTILFVDEVHRWNKAQQDALLPWVENGTVIFVGATTENPFFEVNRALVSRSRIFQLLPLTEEELVRVAKNALENREKGYGKWRVLFEDGALEHLIEVASGDTRSLLNALELAIETTPASWPPPEGSEITISMEIAEESIQQRVVLYDRDGDYHFDTISAFIKSVRGSDVDAALYWLARMVSAGEDPAFIFRRMIILASEDVGMASPTALSVVLSCAEAFDRIGFPEGNFPLAHACIYLATAPKSNSAMGFFDALHEVKKEDAQIPNHLRDASRDKESFGHGKGYIYPHAYREHWTAQQYLPTPLQGKTFYSPSTIGYEGKIRDSILLKKEIQTAALINQISIDKHTFDDFLSWSPEVKGREAWLKKLESGRSSLLVANRDALFGAANPAQHDRILILNAADGLLLWEAARKAPCGLVAACVETEQEKDVLQRYLESDAVLTDNEKPIIAVNKADSILTPQKAEQLFQCNVFDTILGREPWRFLYIQKKANPEITPYKVFHHFAVEIKAILAKNASVVFLQSPPVLGERISRILRAECNLDDVLFNKVQAAEEFFFASAPLPFWDEQTLVSAWSDAGYETTVSLFEQKEARLLTESDIAHWFDTAQSRWGKIIGDCMGEHDFNQIRSLLTVRVKQGPVTWKWKSLLTRSRVPI